MGWFRLAGWTALFVFCLATPAKAERFRPFARTLLGAGRVVGFGAGLLVRGGARVIGAGARIAAAPFVGAAQGFRRGVRGPVRFAPNRGPRFAGGPVGGRGIRGPIGPGPGLGPVHGGGPSQFGGGPIDVTDQFNGNGIGLGGGGLVVDSNGNVVDSFGGPFDASVGAQRPFDNSGFPSNANFRVRFSNDSCLATLTDVTGGNIPQCTAFVSRACSPGGSAQVGSNLTFLPGSDLGGTSLFGKTAIVDQVIGNVARVRFGCDGLSATPSIVDASTAFDIQSRVRPQPGAGSSGDFLCESLVDTDLKTFFDRNTSTLTIRENGAIVKTIAGCTATAPQQLVAVNGIAVRENISCSDPSDGTSLRSFDTRAELVFRGRNRVLPCFRSP